MANSLGRLSRAEDGSRQSTAFYGKILKKRGLEALKAKAKSLLEELGLWLKTMSKTLLICNKIFLFFFFLVPPCINIFGTLYTFT